MKVMLTITGPFDAPLELTSAPQRTMTIGSDDAADLCKRVGAWAHDATARMLALDTDPEMDQDDEPEPLVTGFADVPINLWESLP